MMPPRCLAVAFAASVALSGGGDDRQAAQQRPQQQVARADGPVAIAAINESEAAVLQLHGRITPFDMRRWTPGSAPIFVVPPDYDATDLTAGTGQAGRVLALVLNSHVPGRNFVLQIVSGRQVWTWLKVQGVYTGVALDAGRGLVYAANSTTNSVYRVKVGEEKQTPQQVAVFRQAERIGPIALDVAGQRLFAADSDGHRIFVHDLERNRTSTVPVGDLGEMRALVWDGSCRQLYVADSGSEAIWSVAVDGLSSAQLVVRDPRFRQPSGLTIGPQGLVVATDESAAAVFAVSPGDRAVRSVARLPAVLK